MFLYECDVGGIINEVVILALILQFRNQRKKESFSMWNVINYYMLCTTFQMFSLRFRLLWKLRWLAFNCQLNSPRGNSENNFWAHSIDYNINTDYTNCLIVFVMRLVGHTLKIKSIYFFLSKVLTWQEESKCEMYCAN